MSNTPRADLDLHWIEAHGLRMNHKYVSYVLAQDLESQLNEARKLIKNLNNLCYTKEAQEYLDRIEKGTE
jgi:hypothetical protein